MAPAANSRPAMELLVPQQAMSIDRPRDAFQHHLDRLSWEFEQLRQDLVGCAIHGLYPVLSMRYVYLLSSKLLESIKERVGMRRRTSSTSTLALPCHRTQQTIHNNNSKETE